MDCKFCKALKDHRDTVAFLADHYPYKSEEETFWRWTIIDESVAIVFRKTHIRPDGKRVGTISTATIFKDDERGFDLNYCPECGKEIKR